MYDFYTVYVIGVIDFSTITFIKFLCAELEYFTDTLVFASMGNQLNFGREIELIYCNISIWVLICLVIWL